MEKRVLVLIALLMVSVVQLPGVGASTAVFSEDFDDVHVATDAFSFSANSYFWPSDSWEILHDVTFSWPEARILLGVYGDFTVDVGVTTDSGGSSSDYGKMRLYWYYPNGEEGFDSPYWYKDTTYTYFKKKEDYSMSVTSLRYYIAGQNVDGFQVSFDMSGTVEVLTDIKYRHYELSISPSQVFVTSEYGKSMKIKKAKLYTDITTPSEGIIRMRVYWDGSDVTLGSFASVSGGVLYVGGVSTGLSLTQNAWHYIVIAWSDTEQDYVYINTIDNIFYGSFSIDASYFGSISHDTNTLIDDIEIYNYYVTPEQAAYLEQGVYAIKAAGGKTYVVYPEGGEGLGTLSVTFMSDNGTVLGTVQLTDSDPLVTAPENISRISIGRDNVERIYNLNGISTAELAFPALADIVVKAIKVYVYPSSWNSLEVKTLDGKVVYRDNITTEASVTLIYGKYYTFTVEGLNSNNETVTYSLVAQATDNLKLRFPDPDEAFKIETDIEKLIAKKDGDDLFAQFVSPQQVSGTFIVEAFDANNHKIYYVDSYFSGSSYTIQQDISDLEEALGREISYFRVTVKAGNFTATKLVANKINFSYLLSESFFPHGLRLIFFTIIGTFLVGRKNSDLSPLTAFIVISLMALVGWISPSAWFVAELSVLAGVSLYMSTIDTELGRNIEALSRIKIWRIPLSFWILAVTLSYAPVIAKMMWPFFDFSDVYYSVKFMDDTVMQWFRGLAESSDWLTSTFGQVLYVGATGIKAIFMLLEGIVTGFLPAWKVMGLDTPIGDSPLTMANIAQSLVYMAYAWTLYMARKGGVEA